MRRTVSILTFGRWTLLHPESDALGGAHGNRHGARMSASDSDRFLEQAKWCRAFGSPFTAALMEALAADVAAFGPTAAILAQIPDLRRADAMPLRIAGALHALVLSGRDPELAAEYPPQRRDWDMARLFERAQAAMERDPDWFRSFLAHPPQTNEMRRAIALLPAFAAAAADGGPLHMLEIGASGGLNVSWDQFAYRTREWAYGRIGEDRPIVDTEWRGSAPTLRLRLDVESRAGCDQNPLDVRDPDQVLRLKSYVWPDQRDRIDRFDRAVALAIANDVRVERADAAAWLKGRLVGRLPEGVTILYHSIAWQYFSAETKTGLFETIERTARIAESRRRFAWVRFEHDRILGYAEDGYSVDLAIWPGGERRRIARTDPHARWVDVI
jgi:hypothetical protein